MPLAVINSAYNKHFVIGRAKFGTNFPSDSFTSFYDNYGILDPILIDGYYETIYFKDPTHFIFGIASNQLNSTTTDAHNNFYKGSYIVFLEHHHYYENDLYAKVAQTFITGNIKQHLSKYKFKKSKEAYLASIRVSGLSSQYNLTWDASLLMSKYEHLYGVQSYIRLAKNALYDIPSLQLSFGIHLKSRFAFNMVPADTHSIHTFSNHGNLYTINLQYASQKKFTIGIQQILLDTKWKARLGDSINRVPIPSKYKHFSILTLKYKF
jgi:hypothetical protein